MKSSLGRRRLPPRSSLLGLPAAPIAGCDPAGAPAGRHWDAGGRQLVAFLTGGCTTCQLFWTALASPAAVPDLPVVVVTPGAGTESRRGIASRLAGGFGPQVVMSTEAWIAYGVRGAPWFVVVADGTVAAEGTAASLDELGALTAIPA